MGFRPGFLGAVNPKWNNQGPYPTLFRHYIRWTDLERTESDGVQKMIDFCNTQWAGAEKANVKIIPRLILQWDDTTFYFPSDIPNGDYSSQKIKDRVRRMIQRLGQVWDNDPRVAWIQTGIIGKWGEQESPVNVRDNNNEWAKILGAEFQAAFPNKLKVVRNQQYWNKEGYNWGVYWDSFAHTGQYTGSWQDIKNTNAQGHWKTEPIEGEVAYDWGNERSNYALPTSDPNKAWNVNSTVQNPNFYNFIINTIRQLHCSSLGWVDGYDKADPTCWEGASQIQKAFGYRFVISEFSCPRQTAPGGLLNLSFKVTNAGSAPILAPVLENWQLAFTLINESTRQIVWTAPLPGNTNIRNWLPGDNYDWDPRSNPNGAKTYRTPALEHAIIASINVPADIPAGEYLAGITILDPSTQKPGVFFAIRNFFKESQAQPLCRIGIGQALAGSPDINPAAFNDLVVDDLRSYGLTPTNLIPVTMATSASAVVAGTPAEFTTSVAGITPRSYQWRLNGLMIEGATAATYRLPNAQAFHAGEYSVVVTATSGSAFTSPAKTLTVAAAPASTARLLNLSTRALGLAGNNQLIPGFVLSGTGTKRILARAVGPGLFDSFGLTGVLGDPQMSLNRQDTSAAIATNNDWGTNINKAQIITTSVTLGAFPLLDASKDAVILADLPAGAYTVPTADAAGGSGLAIVELYDADAGPSTCRLVNISNRGFIDLGDKIMISGFVLSGEGARTFLIRAVGPGLNSSFGLTGVLADPVLTVFREGNAILSNDDWGASPGAATTTSTAASVGAFPLAVGSKDAAFVVTLSPGAYTVHVTGKPSSGSGQGTGVALVEVYLVP